MVLDEYEACISHGISISVIEVKSHETDIEQVPKELQDGNNCAAYHAGQAVTEYPTGEANMIRTIDSKARWFQERMIRAILLLPKKGRHPQESQHISEVETTRQPHITQRVARAKILKHDVFRRGPMLECLRCGQVWESTASSHNFLGRPLPRPEIIWRTPKR